MAKTRELPNLENATPSFLIDSIAEQREIQKDAKFLEGVYREALTSRLAEGQTAIEGDKYVGNLSTSDVERIDTEAVRQAFSREELITLKFLKVSQVTTLKTLPKA